MPGYIWDPVVRIVPRNGTDIVYWFADELTDVKGATKIALRYVEEFENHEDVNRSLRPIVFGLRPEVDITCVILSMEDQRFLADIESALLLPRDYDVFLSLDGGVVERQVVLAKAIDFEPIRGKTVIGASFTLSLKCVDLIDQRPAMITDPGVGVEKLIDPSVEMWVGGVPTHWTHSSASITVTQETVAVRNPGGNSARVLRLNAGFISFQPWLVFPQMSGTGNLLKRSCWYRYRGSVLGVGIAINAYRLQIFNASRATSVSSDGKTWGNSSQDLIPSAAILNGAWADYETYFRLPRDVDPLDAIYPRLCGYFGEVSEVCYDEMSIYGPVLKPGVATW